MGVGSVLGGVVGRYAVGGRKSSKTILGTSIGAAAGALVLVLGGGGTRPAALRILKNGLCEVPSSLRYMYP